MRHGGGAHPRAPVPLPAQCADAADLHRALSGRGGAALAGESSLQAIQRELFEETGIRAEPCEFHLAETYCRRGDNYICDIYFLIKDVPLEALTMQPGETCEAKWVNRQELEDMIADGIVARPDVRRYRQLDSKLDKYLR